MGNIRDYANEIRYYIDLTLGLKKAYEGTKDTIMRIKSSAHANGVEDKGEIRRASNTLKSRVNGVVREVPNEIRLSEGLNILLGKAIKLIELEDVED